MSEKGKQNNFRIITTKCDAALLCMIATCEAKRSFYDLANDNVRATESSSKWMMMKHIACRMHKNRGFS